MSGRAGLPKGELAALSSSGLSGDPAYTSSPLLFAEISPNLRTSAASKQQLLPPPCLPLIRILIQLDLRLRRILGLFIPPPSPPPPIYSHTLLHHLRTLPHRLPIHPLDRPLPRRSPPFTDIPPPSPRHPHRSHPQTALTARNRPRFDTYPRSGLSRLCDPLARRGGP